MNWAVLRMTVKRILRVFLGTKIGEMFFRRCLKISDHFHLGNYEGQHRFNYFPKKRSQENGQFQIVYYHRVTDLDPYWGGIPVQSFRLQMENLAKYFQVLPLEELLYRTTEGRVPPRSMAITFDDGYEDNYENGFPILKKLGIPATIFLATGGINDQEMLWHDKIFCGFYLAQSPSVRIHEQEFSLSNISQRATALNEFRSFLRQFPYSTWTKRVDQLLMELDVDQEECWPFVRKLKWEQIKQMQKSQISFGAHTVTHPILTCLSREDAEQEILESKKRIEQEIGEPVNLFAYPNGGEKDFDKEVKSIIQKLGFSAAVTTIFGGNSRETDSFELQRIGGGETDPHVFIAQMGWYHFIC